MADELPHGGGTAAVHFEANGRAEAPPADVLRDGAQQVGGFVLADLHVGVARHAEGGRAADLHTREELRQVRLDEMFEEEEVRRAASFRRHRHEPRQRRGHLDAREARAAVLLLGKLDGEREREVRNEREGVGRVERERRQHRKDHALEVSRQLLAPLGLDRVPGQDAHALLGELGENVLGQGLRGEVQVAAHDLADRPELFDGGEPVRALLGHGRLELVVEARDADHEELVQVRMEDAEEFQPLQERPVRVEGLLEYPPVEGEPGDFPVEVERPVLEPVLGTCRFDETGFGHGEGC